MGEVKEIKAADMFPFVKELLNDGCKAWIINTGMSMYPFLREHRDCVELSVTDFDSIKRGDIVLIKRFSGEYILHRVLRKNKDCFYIIGDAQQWIEGPLKPEQLIAVVTAVRRDNRQFTCQSKKWRLLVAIWLYMIPVRHLFLKGIRFITKFA